MDNNFNMTVMKKFDLKYIQISLVVILALWSCATENNEDAAVNVNPVVNPYDFLGELHNSGLDAVRDSLSSSRSISTQTEEDVIRFAKQYCEHVLNTDERLLSSDSVALGNIIAVDLGRTRAGNDDFMDVTDTVYSEKALTLLKTIIDISETNDYTYIKEQFAKIEEDILRTHADEYTEIDRTILLGSLSVGKYSNEYWNGTDFASGTRSGVPFRTIVKADLVGAARGIWANRFVICVCAIGGAHGVVVAMVRSALPSAVGASALHWFINS